MLLTWHPEGSSWRYVIYLPGAYSQHDYRSGEARVPLKLLHLDTVLCHFIFQGLYLF